MFLLFVASLLLALISAHPLVWGWDGDVQVVVFHESAYLTALLSYDVAMVLKRNAHLPLYIICYLCFLSIAFIRDVCCLSSFSLLTSAPPFKNSLTHLAWPLSEAIKRDFYIISNKMFE